MPFLSGWPKLKTPQEIAAEQVHVWGWPLDSVPEAGAIALLNDEERSRLQRFLFEPDRNRFGIAHANLRRILGGYLRLPPDQLVFRANRFGKPEVLAGGGTPEIRFNLSHSRSAALLAVSRDTEVGIDIEDVRPIEAEIAESYFSRAEQAALATLEGDAWLRGFYSCWTRKEAILKGEGVGLSSPLDSFDVSLIPGAPAELLGVRPEAGFCHRWRLHDLSIDGGQIAALAVANPDAEVSCFELCMGS